MHAARLLAAATHQRALAALSRALICVLQLQLLLPGVAPEPQASQQEQQELVSRAVAAASQLLQSLQVRPEHSAPLDFHQDQGMHQGHNPCFNGFAVIGWCLTVWDRG